jgi:hypothetical protein
LPREVPVRAPLQNSRARAGLQHWLLLSLQQLTLRLWRYVIVGGAETVSGSSRLVGQSGDWDAFSPGSCERDTEQGERKHLPSSSARTRGFDHPWCQQNE